MTRSDLAVTRSEPHERTALVGFFVCENIGLVRDVEGGEQLLTEMPKELLWFVALDVKKTLDS